MGKFLQKHQIERLQRGQSLVEMAFGFVLLLIVLSGLLDIGRAYFTYIAMEDGAGEAALYLAIDPDCGQASDHPEDPGRCADPNNATFRAREAGNENINWSNAKIDFSRPRVYAVGAQVSVTIEYPMTLLSPFMPRFAGMNPIFLKVQATQII